jgi:hypothetical protein
VQPLVWCDDRVQGWDIMVKVCSERIERSPSSVDVMEQTGVIAGCSVSGSTSAVRMYQCTVVKEPDPLN